ncbi:MULTISPECIES: hypothetical protein [Brenneria]|uniref:Uncharacterized protein n=1 Tax=Brenneria nigrifluens DSM 30175 = ATCC 13028 TaxID=1121120 RepID=A0A2U1UW20_9GAMM|nr:MULTISPECIES: hypothetical protein [Brenneria]EHD22798.1 hypothetical protein BrE312_3437 [Brenneria sp. EniD312]PWC25847.1 hypothetical protein DDT54_00490 [Brenneria nigrifluens DSM 30175 = ATCC 13028]QCR05769.1 hypothetical protein EH206_17225 [Brenneria nigrifluens DSM 30175 = ATCC 13028]
MAKDKNKIKGSAPKSEAQRQSVRREKLEKEFGKAVTLHMSEANKKRLDQVTEKLTGNYRPGTRERSVTIAELVNQYYISYIMPRSGKIAEYIYEKYGEIWEMQFVEEMRDKEIVAIMNKRGDEVPTKNEDGTISLEKRKWQEDDVSLYRDAESVGKLMKKVNDSSDY